MNRFIKIFIILGVVISFIGCDQATKRIAQSNLEYSSPKSFLRGIVHFQYAENTGAFLGIGSQLPHAVRFAFILCMTVLVVAVFVAFLMYAQRLDRIKITALSLFSAGALSNLIDRLWNDGSVIDFVILRIGPLHTGIFNIADVLIIAGITLFLFSKKHTKRMLPPQRHKMSA